MVGFYRILRDFKRIFQDFRDFKRIFRDFSVISIDTFQEMTRGISEDSLKILQIEWKILEHFEYLKLSQRQDSFGILLGFFWDSLRILLENHIVSVRSGYGQNIAPGR